MAYLTGMGNLSTMHSDTNLH